MTPKPDARGDVHEGTGHALREFEETRESGLDARAEARERFVHGLLWAQRDARSERRIAALRERLQAEPNGARAARSGAGSRTLRFWQRISIAASLLLFLGFGAFGWIRTDEPEALALAEQAIAETERGVHVYEARFMLYDKASRVQRERIWRVVLAPDGRYHLQQRRQRLPIAIASNGEHTWMVPPRGKPFLIPPPMPIERYVGELGPELSYYQLRPMLRRLLRESQLEATSYERDPWGQRFAVLEGAFRPSEGGDGSVRLVIGVEDGRLAELLVQAPHGEGRSSFQLTRTRIPEDLAGAGIDFDPPTDLTHPPGMQLGFWLGQFLAAKQHHGERSAGPQTGSSSR